MILILGVTLVVVDATGDDNADGLAVVVGLVVVIVVVING